MRLIGYAGTDGECVIIESPKDLYPVLDWIHSRMVELWESNDDPEAEKCANFLSKLMDEAEKEGFGNIDDIDQIQYF